MQRIAAALVAVLWGSVTADGAQLPPETSLGAQKELVVGDVAPGFDTGGTLQFLEGEDLEFSSLRGKTVVFEFWATWCVPCIQAIPHWNDLIKELSGKPITFISISIDEDESRLRDLLKSTPILGLSAWDPDRKWFKAYQGTSVPHTVIVDSAGKIAGITSLKKLTVGILEKITNGDPFNLPPKQVSSANADWDRKEIGWDDGIEPLAQVIIKPVSVTGSALNYSPGSNRLSGDGLRLETLVHTAYETSLLYLDYRLPHSRQGYRVSAFVPQGQEARLLPLLRETLKASLGLSIRWETQEKEVLVLKQLLGEESRLRPSQAEQSARGWKRGTLYGTKQTMEELCVAVANLMEIPVVAETALSGQYDWELPFQPGNPDVLMASLRKRLGLVAERARRQIQVLVVEKAVSR